jgi:hypothetical protein
MKTKEANVSIEKRRQRKKRKKEPLQIKTSTTLNHQTSNRSF